MNPCHPPLAAVQDAVSRALAEDLLPLGDLTAALVPANMADGRLTPRIDGILAGRLCADEVFRRVDPAITVRWDADDGDRIEARRPFAVVSGPLPAILSAERTALNFLCHLSGVATLTARFVDAAGAGRARIWDTRKTTPGLRSLEKAAVRAGGGRNHRGNLSEMVLVKDNHLAGVSITEAVGVANDRWPGRTIEVECDRLDQVKEAVEAGAGLVMLDNMSVDEARECVEWVDGRALVEVSGGVTLDTVGDYSKTGADLISTSVITQSAPALDIGLDL